MTQIEEQTAEARKETQQAPRRSSNEEFDQAQKDEEKKLNDEIDKLREGLRGASNSTSRRSSSGVEIVLTRGQKSMNEQVAALEQKRDREDQPDRHRSGGQGPPRAGLVQDVGGALPADRAVGVGGGRLHHPARPRARGRVPIPAAIVGSDRGRPRPDRTSFSTTWNPWHPILENRDEREYKDHCFPCRRRDRGARRLAHETRAGRRERGRPGHALVPRLQGSAGRREPRHRQVRRGDRRRDPVRGRPGRAASGRSPRTTAIRPTPRSTSPRPPPA